jgi:hypothetical protein
MNPEVRNSWCEMSIQFTLSLGVKLKSLKVGIDLVGIVFDRAARISELSEIAAMRTQWADAQPHSGKPCDGRDWHRKSVTDVTGLKRDTLSNKRMRLSWHNHFATD